MGQLITVSPDRLECQLGELTLDELLRSCEERSLSGQISVECDGWPGTILLESGHTITASYQNRVGPAALSLMKELRSGELELCRHVQAEGSDRHEVAREAGEASGTGEASIIDALGDLIEISIAALMRHGEDSELSGCIRLGNGVEVAEMHFALGALTRIAVLDHGELAGVDELVERFRQAGRPLTIGVEDEAQGSETGLEAGWEGPTNVRPRARLDDTGEVIEVIDVIELGEPAEEPAMGIPYPVLDEMPTQPWRRPDEATVQVKLARYAPARPWWRQPYAVPSAIAVTAALSCLLLGMLL